MAPCSSRMRGSVAVGRTNDLPDSADVVINARGMVILPGLVNTHHHFFQTLTRNVPAAQNAKLFDWLVNHYPIGRRSRRPDRARQNAIAELMLSGCTTASDHTYIWPNGARLDDQIDAAREFGLPLSRRARVDVGWRIERRAAA